MKEKSVGKVVAALLAAALMLPIFSVGEALADDVTGTQGQTGLTEGETYWFDLSDVGIPGAVNTDLPSGLSWVPFTYVGEVDAYVLNSSSNGVTESSDKAADATEASSDEDKTYGYKYKHSLFIADYNVAYNMSWSDLNDAGLIFGETYSSGGIEYILRAPSMGNNTGVNYDYSKGVPGNNELDAILSKNENAVKNYYGTYFWGQDTYISDASNRSHWGLIPNEYFTSPLHLFSPSTAKDTNTGYRPVLELPASLSSADLTTVTIDLNGGSLNSSPEPVTLIVKSGERFTAPSVDGLIPPEGKGGGYWKAGNGTDYRSGDTVSVGVTSLTAQWIDLPVVTEQLQSATYYVGDTALPLTVDASVADGGGLEYRWYSATKDDFTDISEIAGASSSSYTPATTAVGTTYYFCSVINVNGIGISAIMLGPAKVIVKAKDTTPPVISGIEDGKTYCSAVTFTVVDDNLDSVTASVTTADGTTTETLTPDSEGNYTLKAVNETYTVTATDTAGSKTEYKVTVNDGHTFEWKIDKEAAVGVTGSRHEECTVCGYAKAAVEIPALPEPESPIEDENNDGTDDGNSGGNGDEYGDVNGGASGDVKGNVADRKQDGGDEGVSDDNSAQDGGVRAVQTGDDGSAVLPLMSLLMSSFGITGSIAYGQKKRKMRK